MGSREEINQEITRCFHFENLRRKIERKDRFVLSFRISRSIKERTLLILLGGVKSVFEYKPDRKQNVLNRLNGDLNVGSIDRKRKKIGRGEKIREDGTLNF